MSFKCNPCMYHYDYIAKMETYDRDSNAVIRKVFKSVSICLSVSLSLYLSMYNSLSFVFLFTSLILKYKFILY